MARMTAVRRNAASQKPPESGDDIIVLANPASGIAKIPAAKS